MPIVSFFGDRISFPGNMSSDEISDVLGALQAGAFASGEFIATLATGAVAEPLSGLAALATTDPSLTGDEQAKADAALVGTIQDRLTYQPRTEAGQRAMQRIGEDIKALAESTGLDNLSGYWRDRVVPALQQQAGTIAGSVLAAGGLALIVGLLEASPGGKALPKRQAGAITAFHGSPHIFSEFKMSKVGTGEGAQAYGHGLYFAESEDVARTYRSSTNLADKRRQFLDELPEDADFDAVFEEMDKFSPEMKELVHALDEDDWLGFDYPSQAIDAALGPNASNFDMSPRLIRARNKGLLYEVDLDVDADDLLDWDLPLSEQKWLSEGSVDDIIKRTKGRKPTEIEKLSVLVKDPSSVLHRQTGQQLFDSMRVKQGSPAGASEALNRAGIRGIKYKDALSRSAEGGTRNYVIFDEKIISIAKKYGLSVPIASAVLSGEMTLEQAQSQSAN